MPFVILTMTPFIEQIDPRIESAARMCGAGLRTVFLRILTPLLVPGILASAILVLVRTVGMFELTFLTAGPDSQTLVVALYYSMSASGIRAQQSVDAMAVIYTSMMLVLLVVALRYVNPTQLVARVRTSRSTEDGAGCRLVEDLSQPARDRDECGQFRPQTAVRRSEGRVDRDRLGAGTLGIELGDAPGDRGQGRSRTARARPRRGRLCRSHPTPAPGNPGPRPSPHATAEIGTRRRPGGRC
ncbi:ABC transporter permease subunit [Micromonospora sp. M12]